MSDAIQTREHADGGQPSAWAPLRHRVFRDLFIAQFRLEPRDLDAKCGGAMVFGRDAQHCRHRGTGPDGESWLNAHFGLVRRRACRSIRPTAAADCSAVVRRGGYAGLGGVDIPRPPYPGVTVVVHRRHWPRLRTDRTGLAGDSTRGRLPRPDTGRRDLGHRLGEHLPSDRTRDWRRRGGIDRPGSGFRDQRDIVYRYHHCPGRLATTQAYLANRTRTPRPGPSSPA